MGEGERASLPAPASRWPASAAECGRAERPRAAGIADHSESEEEFERRAAAATEIAGSERARRSRAARRERDGARRARSRRSRSTTRSSPPIPDYEHNDQVLYQKARAYDELGRTDEAIAVIERLIAEYPHSTHIDEVQFRRAEYFFTRKKYLDAEEAYSAVTTMGVGSEYYELALYKLGWTLYKQEIHEEALHEYMALLDYKVSVGYDFDQSRGRGRRAPDRGHLPRHQPQLLEPRRSGGRRGLLHRERAPQLRGPHLLAPRRVLPREAPLRRRRGRLQGVRRALSLPPHLAPLRHARGRDLRGGRLPEAGARVEEGVRGQLRPAVRVLASLRRRRFAGGPGLSEDQPGGPGEPLPRALPGREARQGQARELRRGAALVPRLSRFVPRGAGDAQHRLSPGRSAPRARGLRRSGAASTSAPPTTIPRTSSAAAAGYAAIYAHRSDQKRAPERRARSRPAGDRREHAAVRGHVPRGTSMPPPCWAPRPTTSTT